MSNSVRLVSDAYAQYLAEEKSRRIGSGASQKWEPRLLCADPRKGEVGVHYGSEVDAAFAFAGVR